MLKFSLSYDITDLQQNKNSLRETGLPGRLTVDGKQMAIKVLPRGAGSFFCKQPQLKLDFANSIAEGTPFAGLKKVKLFTSGRCLEPVTDPMIDKTVLANYLIYKLAEQVSPFSFKTRLVEISYKDTSGKTLPYKQMAFFLEPEKQIERRLGLKRVEEPELIQLGIEKLVGLYDPASVSSAHAFEFFIGNYDYGIPGFYSHTVESAQPLEKNVHVYRDKDGRLHPLVFDFDFSRLNYAYGFCGVAAPFKQVGQHDLSCEISHLVETYKADMEYFKFKEDFVREFPRLKQEFLQWREENKGAIDELGPEHAKGLDAMLEAFDLVLKN